MSLLIVSRLCAGCESIGFYQHSKLQIDQKNLILLVSNSIMNITYDIDGKRKGEILFCNENSE